MKNRKFKMIQGVFTMVMVMFIGLSSSYAHCDSYDGPVIKEALLALETNDVTLLTKWIDKSQEKEIFSLFKKTYNLRNGDPEIYAIVEKHFLETLVRLHRETEGEPFTGLKPAGSVSPIIRMADESLESGDFNRLDRELSAHLTQVLKEKHRKAFELSKEKNESAAKGRAYVEAYVEYTHTLEAIHGVIEHGPGAHGEAH